VDRGLIRNELTVDNTDVYNSVVDIVIDNVGDQSIGNRSGYNTFLNALVDNASKLRGFLDVVRPGLLIEIDYRIENQRTGRFLRQATAKMYTENKAHFIDLNSKDLNDNAVLVNFSDTMVKTVTNQIHGADKMIIRLTKVRLFYVCLKRLEKNPYDHRQLPHHSHEPVFRPDGPVMRYDRDYHRNHQPQYAFGREQYRYPDQMTVPPNWWSFNRFYHFEDKGRTIMLHWGELNDLNAPTFKIPVGSINLNKSFLCNTSFKIMFKVSVWKNDLTVLNNTAAVARLLGVPSLPGYHQPKLGRADLNGKVDAILGLVSRMTRDNLKRDYQIGKLRAGIHGRPDWNPMDDPLDPDDPQGGQPPPFLGDDPDDQLPDPGGYEPYEPDESYEPDEDFGPEPYDHRDCLYDHGACPACGQYLDHFGLCHNPTCPG
jgi:hypothetical protein